MLFKKGQSGNPSGRPSKPKTLEAQQILKDVKACAKAHSESAVKTLVEIMESKKAPSAARLLAANSLLDRAWGKPTQFVDAQVSNLDRMSDDELRALIASAASGDSRGAGGLEPPEREEIVRGIAH